MNGIPGNNMIDTCPPLKCQRCHSMMTFQNYGSRYHSRDYDTVKWCYKHYWCPGCKTGYLVTIDCKEMPKEKRHYTFPHQKWCNTCAFKRDPDMCPGLQGDVYTYRASEVSNTDLLTDITSLIGCASWEPLQPR